MIILDATDKQLEIVLGGVVTTNELPFVAAFVDHDGATPAFTPGEQDGLSNGATSVVVMASPAASIQRQLKFLSVFNADTVAATLTVQYDNAATNRTILSVTLAVGDNLIYTDGGGFRIIDSNGQIRTAPDADVARKSVAETVVGAWIFDADVELNRRVRRSKESITLGAAVTTFVIARDFVVLTGDAGANTIATITGGLDGQILRLLFVDALVTITDANTHAANTVDLGAAFTSADDTVLLLMFDGTSWYEVSRSVN